MNTEKFKTALEELVTLIEQADTFEWRGTYIGYIEESKDRAKELLAAPPSSPTATAEEDFARHFDKFRFGLYKASFDHYLETGKISGSLLLAVREYASLKEQEARRQAIQECIDMLDVYGLGQAVEVLRAKLKVEGK